MLFNFFYLEVQTSGLSTITGFADFDAPVEATGVVVPKNQGLEQLKQRLPWNQPSTPPSSQPIQVIFIIIYLINIFLINQYYTLKRFSFQIEVPMVLITFSFNYLLNHPSSMKLCKLTSFKIFLLNNVFRLHLLNRLKEQQLSQAILSQNQ